MKILNIEIVFESKSTYLPWTEQLDYFLSLLPSCFEPLLRFLQNVYLIILHTGALGRVQYSINAEQFTYKYVV